MHLVLTLLFAVLTLVTAVPTPALVPRGECSTVGPYLLQQLDSTNPLLPYSNSFTTSGASSSVFTVSQNNVNAHRSVQLVSFKIPSGSHTCTLYIADTQSSVAYTQASAPPLNVISLVPNSVTFGINYAALFEPKPYTAMVESHGWGTVTLTRGEPGMVLNSRACPGPSVNGDYGTLAFVFEFMRTGPSQVQGGREEIFSLNQSFSSTAVVGKVTGINGVYMTYNC